MADNSLDKLLQKDFLYDELLCGFVSFSADGNILSINKTLAEWTGMELPIAENRNFKSLMTKSSLLYYSMVVEPILNLKPEVYEINLKFSGRSGIFDALVNARSYKKDDGTISLITAVVLKISERKQFESALIAEKRQAEEERRRYEFLFNFTPVLIWTMDPRGSIQTVNQKVRDNFNVDADNLHQGVVSLFYDNKFKNLRLFKELLNKGQRFEREMKLQVSNGRYEWFLIRAEPYADDNGSIEVWFCSGININRRKLLQLANQAEWQSSLSSAYKKIDANEEMFVEIALNQAHMVRKPLANIMGLISLIGDEPLPDDAKILFDMLISSASELDEMLRNNIK